MQTVETTTSSPNNTNAPVGSSGDESYSIILKGLIFISLGGYSGQASGLNTVENTDKVLSSMTDFLVKTGMGIVPINGKLVMKPIVTKKKSWWKFW